MMSIMMDNYFIKGNTTLESVLRAIQEATDGHTNRHQDQQQQQQLLGKLSELSFSIDSNLDLDEGVPISSR